MKLDLASVSCECDRSAVVMVPEGPAVVSSKRQVVYRRSEWAVHEFEVWSGALVCRAAALRMRGSLLLWVGGGGGGGGARPAFGELALGMPGAGAGAALATTLAGAGAGAEAAALARRLAAALRRPVWVAADLAVDRFSAPLVTQGLIAEIKNRPDFFNDPDEPEISDRAS